MWHLKTKQTDKKTGTLLAVQWLRVHAYTAGSTSPISGWNTKILHALWCNQKKKKKIRGETKKPDEQKSNKIKPRPVVAKSEGAGWNGLRMSEGTKSQL